MVAVRTASNSVFFGCARELLSRKRGVRLYKSQSIKSRAVGAGRRLKMLSLIETLRDFVAIS